MAQLSEAERLKLASKKGASRWRYLSSAQLLEARKGLWSDAEDLAEEFDRCAEQSPANVTRMTDLINAMHKIRGQMARITTILRDRWEE